MVVGTKRVLGRLWMASNIKKEIGINLRELMEESGLYQAKLAKILGVRDSTIGDWLKGKAMPGADSLDKMIDKIGWTKRQIMIGKDDVTPAEKLIMDHNQSNSPIVMGLRRSS